MGKRRKYFTDEERAAAQRAAFKRYYARRREEVKARIAAWKEKNHERMRAYKNAYYQRNKAKIKAVRKRAAENAAGKVKRQKYEEFTKEAQGRPVLVNDGERFSAKQKAILRRIATAITADDIE